MKKPIYIALFLSLLLPSIYSNPIFAQENITTDVAGRVRDNENKPAAYATVTLLQSTDSSLAKGAITDDNGAYHFQHVPYGKYMICVSVIGMVKAYSNAFVLNSTHSSIRLAPITLQPNSQLLTSVQVNASKPFIQHKPGQTIVNVENSAVSAGNTVMEVLEKSPGVIVDKDGNISLNGKNGVMVMMNGRPTHLSASQLASVLKSLPASAVSSIELMTQPPAKYSAEGTAGLINIVMKKNTNMGFNGSLTAGTGYGPSMKYNGGGSLNYRNKTLSAYANYHFQHNDNKSEMDIVRRFYNGDKTKMTSILKQASIMKFSSDDHTAELGLDYAITPDHSIGFVLNGSFNNGAFNSFSPVHFLDPDGRTDSISTSRNHNGIDWQNTSANLHYDWTMDSSGSKLSANLDYGNFHMPSPQYNRADVVDAAGDTLHAPDLRRGSQPNTLHIYAAKIDYTHPMHKNAKLEAGLKVSLVNTDNNSRFETFKNNKWVTDYGATNHFIYKENVNAAYLNYNKSFKKGWGLQLGLRGEQTITRAEQRTTDSITNRNYFQLFPNVAVSKTINADNIFSLSYARRIDRPSYQSLNPFLYYVDKYTYAAGNPYLQPELVRSLELSYTFKRRYTAVLSYSHTRDIMTQVIRQIDSTHITYQTQDNLSGRNDISLNLGIPVAITPWWNTYNSLMFLYNQYKGTYNGYALNKGIASFMFNTQQSFMLPHHWKAELSGMYRTGMVMGPFVTNPMGMVSAGISKSLLHDHATIKLNVQDIFQTMNVKGALDFGNIDMNTKILLYRRAANLTFTWNFGNQKIKVQKHKNSGIQEEQSRIKKGNAQ